MSDEEDYLSDKFLVEAAASSSQPKTYAQRRQESLKQSRTKNEQNRLKNRRQREQESREEALHKSLFERAKEDDRGGENKALEIMLKMGFKMGQSLGQQASAHESASPSPGDAPQPPEQRNVSSDSTHRVEPLPLNEWSGKKGIGSGKRARSPGASDRLAKMAKAAEDANKEDFRDFHRRGYEEKRAEARLTHAQRTCKTLDDLAGVTFNVLWMNFNDVGSIPSRLMDTLSDYAQDVSPVLSGKGDEAIRLRDQMRLDALQPVASDEDDNTLDDGRGMDRTTQQEDFAIETVEEAAHFLHLGPQDRLSLVLAYLRDKHSYCFWCGSKYEDDSDLKEHCPGPNEDDHD